MAGITFKGIKKTYDGKTFVVHDFNLEIKDKEFVVFVGPSGCGKSTILRMIAGLEEISDGELYIGDRLVNDIPPKNRNISMVFQNYALYPHMSVRKNMAFGLKLRKVPEEQINQKIMEAAKILDIEQYLDRKPRALSGGQRQRVALGRAMVRDAEVFLLDEPLSNLDAKLRTQMRTEITKLHRVLGTTFVYVTHDQTEAMTMGDRIVVMKDGYIQQVDKPQNLYDKPDTVFVAGFIGSPQMNFFDAKLIKDGDNLTLSIGNMTIPLPTGKGADSNLAEYVGKEVIVGIRPEDIHNEDVFINLSEGSAFDAKVELAELMGSEIYLYFDYQGYKVIARVASRSAIERGDIVKLSFDINKMHIFDKETENVICH
ncbi:MAG: sn-glycerol-3-phosphate ABC transporter ATP-binding protein UgpC [Oscillospiraceae bacterium]|nr:sn-glycerol-3-phosphate ABC transporter ATP-binding protein UgpC [Oscillospiraceae bacterium]